MTYVNQITQKIFYRQREGLKLMNERWRMFNPHVATTLERGTVMSKRWVRRLPSGRPTFISFDLDRITRKRSEDSKHFRD